MQAEPLISRDELTALLFASQDIREDVRDVRNWLVENDDGETTEENS